ncbi:MAG: hypothetical protein K6G81_04230 [Lachnospiraceae bacterium]|nr:hypothetical protein [Lachnospiraceae bacterium]
MSRILKKAIALIAAFSLVFALVPMNTETVKVQAAEEISISTSQESIWTAKLWYAFRKNITGASSITEWSDRSDAVIAYLKSTGAVDS